MHYGEYAFRNKEWGGMASQITRTIFPSPLSLNAIKVYWILNLSDFSPDVVTVVKVWNCVMISVKCTN